MEEKMLAPWEQQPISTILSIFGGKVVEMKQLNVVDINSIDRSTDYDR
jgi:hypothetical protein